jgi:hypothetical protein
MVAAQLVQAIKPGAAAKVQNSHADPSASLSQSGGIERSRDAPGVQSVLGPHL